jgi:transcriptional regulator with XRE-family HTH domain
MIGPDEAAALRGLVRGRALAHAQRGREAREAAGVSLRELAAVIDVDVSTLSRWERGLCRAQGEGVRRWVDAIDYLEVLSAEAGR